MTVPQGIPQDIWDRAYEVEAAWLEGGGNSWPSDAAVERTARAIMAKAFDGAEGVRELPEDIRVPLHSLQADVDYLFGRVAADGSCASVIAASVKERLSQIEAALTPASTNGGEAFDMLAHLARQRDWSGKTFGPGPRTAGVIDHIRKELREIEADPADISEWIDVVILALDGAWRAGYQPQQIIDAMVAKQTKNEARTWPDWRTMPADKAIEHDRSGEVHPTVPGEVTDEMREVMWAEVVFEGEDNRFLWACDEEGNMDGVHHEMSIELSADTFPVGTKIVVSEPTGDNSNG